MTHVCSAACDGSNHLVTLLTKSEGNSNKKRWIPSAVYSGKTGLHSGCKNHLRVTAVVRGGAGAPSGGRRTRPIPALGICLQFQFCPRWPPNKPRCLWAFVVSSVRRCRGRQPRADPWRLQRARWVLAGHGVRHGSGSERGTHGPPWLGQG